MADAEEGLDRADSAQPTRQSNIKSPWYERYMYVALISAATLLFIVHSAAVGDAPVGLLPKSLFTHKNHGIRVHHHEHPDDATDKSGMFVIDENFEAAKLPPGMRVRRNVMVGSSPAEVETAVTTLNQMIDAWKVMHVHNDISEKAIQKGKLVVEEALSVLADHYLAPRSARVGRPKQTCAHITATLLFPLDEYMVALDSVKTNIVKVFLATVTSLRSQSLRAHSILVGFPALHRITLQTVIIPTEILQHNDIQVVKLPLDYGTGNHLMAALAAEGDPEACIISLAGTHPVGDYSLFNELATWSAAFPGSAIGRQGVNITCVSNPHRAPFLCDLQHSDASHNPLFMVLQAEDQGSDVCKTSVCLRSPTKYGGKAVDIIDISGEMLIPRATVAQDYVKMSRRVARAALMDTVRAASKKLSSQKKNAVDEVLTHPDVEMADTQPELPQNLVAAFSKFASLSLSCYLNTHDIPRVVVELQRTHAAAQGSSMRHIEESVDFDTAMASVKYFHHQS